MIEYSLISDKIYILMGMGRWCMFQDNKTYWASEFLGAYNIHVEEVSFKFLNKTHI